MTLAEFLSRALPPYEREATLGDLAETSGLGWRGAMDLLGLLARRQWLTLAGLIPIAMLLSFYSRVVADGSAITFWLYFNNWDRNLVATTAFRHDFPRFLATVLFSYTKLAFCAWIAGLLVGKFLRAPVAIHGGLFCLVLFCASLGDVHRARDFSPNAAVFAVGFYRQALPIIIQTVLVIIPFIAGLRQSRTIPFFRTAFRNILFASVFSSLAMAAEPATVRAALQQASTRKPAPDFALKDVTGKTIRLSKYHGKTVLLDFWATWCHGCKEEIPWFAKFQKQYEAKGLAVIGVSVDEGGWGVLKPFLKEFGTPYTMVLGDDSMMQRYGLTTLPDTFLIDKRGRIAAAYKAGIVSTQDMESNIKVILSERR